MLDKITYRNHINEEIKLGEFPYFASKNDLRDFEWDYDDINNKISRFSRGISTKKLEIYVVCRNESEAVQRKNALFEVFEKDVLAKEYGRLSIGDYYLNCYVVKSSKADYMKSRNLLKLTVEIVTDNPFWIKETVLRFRKNTNDNEYLDFPYDMPYDFKNSLALMHFNNGNFIKSNFRIVIYGAAENPSLTINSHVYAVETELVANETLTIDSISKTIEQVSVGGTRYNKFKNRNRDSYIFEKIDAGRCAVLPSEKFDFDITVFEERSEPKWT